jgi:molybdate transport system substrate-binding protein
LQTIHFILPVALKDMFDVIAPQFIRDTGHRFETAVMLNPEVPGHIARGDKWSIAASNPKYIQSVVAAKNAAPQIFDLGYTPLSFALRGEHDNAPAKAAKDIAAILKNTSSIGVTNAGTSGAQFDQLLNQLGIYDDVAPKVVRLPGGGPMKELLAGNVQIAALPLTNIAPIKQVTVVASCPTDWGVHIDLAFCLHEKSNEATQEFAAFLAEADLSHLGVLK